MIFGAHFILYSDDAEADRSFLRDVLNLDFVDAGHEWLIFALPPAEAACHPGPGGAELYLMSSDLATDIAALEARGGHCEPVREERWGVASALRLPSGASIGLYQPSHPVAVAQPG